MINQFTGNDNPYEYGTREFFLEEFRQCKEKEKYFTYGRDLNALSDHDLEQAYLAMRDYLMDSAHYSY